MAKKLNNPAPAAGNMVRIVNLENYASPEIKEVKSREYVLFGKKNSFFSYLEDRVSGSTTNGTAISGICNLLYGKGITATNKSEKIDEWAEFLSILKPSDQKQVIADFEVYGQAALQCQWKGGHSKIKSASHVPMSQLAAEKAGENGIEAWYHAEDWSKVRTEEDCTRIPVLGTSKEGLEIKIIRPYQAGRIYYAYPKWFPAAQWAMTEEEISNYHLNAIQNSFAPSLFISLNDGIPDTPEKADEIVDRMMKKYKGTSNAGRVIVSFAANKESESTITPISLSDAPEQYQFLSEEAERKIMSAHRIPSPLLIGIPSKSGFSSNADELKTGSILLETNVLNPDRAIILEAFEDILSYNGISLNLEFESFNPFASEDNVNISTEQDSDKGSVIDSKSISTTNVTSTTSQTELDAQAGLRGSVGGVQGILQIQKSVAEGLTSFDSAVNMLVEIYGFSRDVSVKLLGEKTAQADTINPVPTNLESEDFNLDSLGESLDESEWILIDSREVDYEQEDNFNQQVAEWNADLAGVKLASTGTARPNAKSEQDAEVEGQFFKTRYVYSGDADGEREFCNRMLSAGKLYRKEDIDLMSTKPVNAGFGFKGADTYDIFLYKGGPRCMHKWLRQTYLSKTASIDVKSPLAKKISTNQARGKYKYVVKNPKEVSMKPNDMKYKGFHPDNPNKPADALV